MKIRANVIGLSSRKIANVVAICFVVLVFGRQMLAGRSAGDEERSAREWMEKNGAQLISENQYMIEPGILCKLRWNVGCLSSIEIDLTKENPEYGKMEEWRDSAESRYCCMSRETVLRVIDKINSIKPMGPFLGIKGVDVIPTSGWFKRTREYSEAYIISSERYCGECDVDYASGVDRLIVKYWYRIRGRVKLKKVKVIGPEQFPIMNYTVIVGGKEYPLSEEDSLKVNVGDVICLKYTLDGMDAEIDKCR